MHFYIKYFKKHKQMFYPRHVGIGNGPVFVCLCVCSSQPVLLRNGCTVGVDFLADRTIGRAYGTVCRLSVCLSSSVTFCIVAKRYVLAKNCLKERIGNQGQRVDFLGCRHISTSGFGSTATEMAVFALFLPVQPSNWY